MALSTARPASTSASVPICSAKYRRDPDSLPDLPSTFPRRQWLDFRHFGIPPYGPYEHAFAVAWAGRQASRTWSRCLKNETPDPEGLFTRDPHPEPVDTVDRTCFQLAVFDKAFEVWGPPRLRAEAS